MTPRQPSTTSTREVARFLRDQIGTTTLAALGAHGFRCGRIRETNDAPAHPSLAFHGTLSPNPTVEIVVSLTADEQCAAWVYSRAGQAEGSDPVVHLVVRDVYPADLAAALDPVGQPALG